MECSNRNCKYIFFNKEHTYVFCPECAEIQKEKLPQNDFKRMNIVAKSFKLKKLVKIRHYILLVTVVSPFISFLLYLILKEPSMRIHKNSFTLKHLNFCIGLVMLCFMLLFAFFNEKTMLLKKIIGQNAYYLNCKFFKFVKWLILVFALFIANKYVFPCIYLDSIPKFIDEGRPLYNLDIILYIGEALLIVQSICYVLIDVIELVKRKMCENMINSKIYR